MKKYKFEIVIHEGSDEFWEGIYEKSGCDEVLQCLKDELSVWNPEITLVEYTNVSRK